MFSYKVKLENIVFFFTLGKLFASVKTNPNKGEEAGKFSQMLSPK